MKNASYDAILGDWRQIRTKKSRLAFFTDFFAIRPSAADGKLLYNSYNRVKNSPRLNAEHHMYVGFEHLVKKGTVAWVPNIKRSYAARMQGRNCDIIHHHSLVYSCPNYFDARDPKRGNYRHRHLQESSPDHVA